MHGCLDGWRDTRRCHDWRREKCGRCDGWCDACRRRVRRVGWRDAAQSQRPPTDAALDAAKNDESTASSVATMPRRTRQRTTRRLCHPSRRTTRCDRRVCCDGRCDRRHVGRGKKQRAGCVSRDAVGLRANCEEGCAQGTRRLGLCYACNEDAQATAPDVALRVAAWRFVVVRVWGDAPRLRTGDPATEVALATRTCAS